MSKVKIKVEKVRGFEGLNVTLDLGGPLSLKGKLTLEEVTTLAALLEGVTNCPSAGNCVADALGSGQTSRLVEKLSQGLADREAWASAEVVFDTVVEAPSRDELLYVLRGGRAFGKTARANAAAEEARQRGETVEVVKPQDDPLAVALDMAYNEGEKPNVKSAADLARESHDWAFCCEDNPECQTRYCTRCYIDFNDFEAKEPCKGDK